MSTVHVVVHLKAIPGKEAEVQALLLGLVEPTRAEVGCIAYNLLKSRIDPIEFVLVEEWESVAAMSAHMQSDHVSDAFSKAFQPGEELLAKPPDVHQYSRLQ